jgi:glutamate synthase (NADPH) small chain
MGKPTGFMEYPRQDPKKRPVTERVTDYREVELPLSPEELATQGARCMDCGIPFCHSFGCPLGNRIPEFNDMVYHGQWQRALALLHATNNFPEVTGRICPAPCEAACTLSINKKAVTIKEIELEIVERGWREGWIRPEPAARKSGRRVAVIGSGPAGLAAAQQLARAGHEVVVFEKSARAGGILRFGIPDFKLEKPVLDRRLEQLKAEGVTFETGVDVGADLSAEYLRRKFDAICIAAGARVPRDLAVQGRNLDGIHFAMEFLVQQNRRVAGDTISPDSEILAWGKDVVVIGGGDTGADCVGTARRQGAASITQIELLPEPPAARPTDNPWPTWPLILRSSSSHEEGCTRMWSIQTQEFTRLGTRVAGMKCVKLEWSQPDDKGRRTPLKPVAGSEFDLKAQLVLLALGFVHIEHGPIVEELGLKVDDRGNLVVGADYQTTAPGVFAAGDSVSGASLVVRAIAQGRSMAEAVDKFLNRPTP